MRGKFLDNPAAWTRAQRSTTGYYPPPSLAVRLFNVWRAVAPALAGFLLILWIGALIGFGLAGF